MSFVRPSKATTMPTATSRLSDGLFLTATATASSHSSSEWHAKGQPTPGEGYVSTTEIRFQPFHQRMQVVIQIEGDGRVYRLRGAFVIQLEYLDDDTIFASHKNLPVHGYGAGLDDAIEAFAAMFDVQWRSLVDADVSALTVHARNVRGRLQAVVESVEDL